MKLVNNTAVDPDGQLSSVSWQFLLYNNEQVIYKGSDWVIDPDDNFPGGRAFAYSNQSSATLQFTGSEVPAPAVSACLQLACQILSFAALDAYDELPKPKASGDVQAPKIWAEALALRAKSCKRA